MTGDTGTGDRPRLETTETSLTIRRTFDASRERVFRAFTVPTELEAWQSVGEVTAEVHTLEPEPGGSLSVSHIHGDDRYDLEGEFLEVVENERLVYTWRMVDGPSDGEESRIIVELRDVEEGTGLVFTHEGIAPELVNGTADGWDGMLDNLAAVLRGS